MTNKKKYIIVAVDQENGMGKNGKLPWRLKNEIKYFKKRTTRVADKGKKNAVIMGRKTWESIPENKRPLEGRKNIVLTNKKNYKAKGALVCSSLEEAIDLAQEAKNVEKIFFIGGANVFEQAIQYSDGIYMTEIKKIYHCDVFFPDIPEYFEEAKIIGTDKENGIKYNYLFYKNIDND